VTTVFRIVTHPLAAIRNTKQLENRRLWRAVSDAPHVSNDKGSSARLLQYQISGLNCSASIAFRPSQRTDDLRKKGGFEGRHPGRRHATLRPPLTDV
jgi:hypothetical protein